MSEPARLTGLTAAVIAGALGLSLASEATAQDAGARRSDASLDTIVVTAESREEDQQDVPIAISTATQEFLAANDIRTLEDLNGVIPGLTTTNTVGYGAAPLSIRGVGGANGGGNFFNDEPVGVYIDGVYIARLSVSTADLLDLASVQVLRGPQGTLYGRNSTAGALLLTSYRPTGEFEGHVRAGATSFGDYSASAVASGPLSDNFFGRVAIGYADRSGFGINTFDGTDAGGSTSFTGRASLRFEPSAAMVFDLIGEYQQRSARPALIALSSVGGNGTASPFVLREDLKAVLDSRDFSFNDPAFANSDTYAVTLATEIELDFATLKATTAYRDYRLSGGQDSDSTSLRLFTNEGRTSSKQVSQEIRFVSNADGPFSWLVGGYFLHENAGSVFGIRNYQGLFGLGTQANFDAGQKTEAYAIFADATYAVSRQLSVSVGGRYSSENKAFTNDQIVTILNGGKLPAFFLGGATLPAGFIFADPAPFSDAASFDDFSPRVVVDFAPDNDLLLYASYSQGFKSGGFNSFGLAPAFASEDIQAYEIGLKFDTPDRRIRLNAAGYIYDYSQLQIRLPVPTGGVDIQNVGLAKIIGFEVEGAAVVGTGLTLSANLAVMDATITEGIIPAVASDTGPIALGAPLPLAPVDVSGNRLTRAPKFQTYANAHYAVAIGALDAGFSATYKQQSSVFFLETNQDAATFRNRSWSEVDVRATLSDPHAKWELALFGQNIFDNRHITAVTALGGFPNAAVNEPAKWGLLLTVGF